MQVPTYEPDVLPAVRRRLAGGQARLASPPPAARPARAHAPPPRRLRRHRLRRLAAPGGRCAPCRASSRRCSAASRRRRWRWPPPAAPTPACMPPRRWPAPASRRRSRPSALRRALNAIAAGGRARPRRRRACPTASTPAPRHAARPIATWIWNGRVASPFARRYAWHVPQPLDVEAMAAAAGAVVGEHDFAAFKGQGSAARTTVRRGPDTSELREAPPPEAWGGGAARVLCYEVSGAGFLRYMVRGIVGTARRRRRGKRTATRWAGSWPARPCRHRTDRRRRRA